MWSWSHKIYCMCYGCYFVKLLPAQVTKGARCEKGSRIGWGGGGASPRRFAFDYHIALVTSYRSPTTGSECQSVSLSVSQPVQSASQVYSTTSHRISQCSAIQSASLSACLYVRQSVSLLIQIILVTTRIVVSQCAQHMTD